AINSVGTVSVAASGTPTLSYQWYEGTSPLANAWNISGVNTATLTISPTALTNSGSYHVVITNAYGGITSSVAAVTIVSGPIIYPDLPATNYVLAGTPAILSVGLSGTSPFTNVWTFNGHVLANGGRISGAQTPTLVISNAQASDSGAYQFWSTNSLGTSHSSVGQLVVEYELGISSTNNPDATQWTANSTGPYAPSAVNGVLTMTTAVNGEATAFFFDTRVNIQAFIAQFTYQDVAAGAADGIAFCLQNDPRGLTALGGGGSELGYVGITPSAELCFELYNNSDNAPGYAWATNGAGSAGAVGGGFQYNSTAPVSITSGDPINV